MDLIIQAIIAPAVLLVLGGAGWLFKSIFNLFAENQKESRNAQHEATAAFILYLTKRDEDSTKERNVREDSYRGERNRWIDRLDVNNNTLAEHTEYSKQQTKAIESLGVAVAAINTTLLDIMAVIKEIRELDKFSLER